MARPEDTVRPDDFKLSIVTPLEDTTSPGELQALEHSNGTVIPGHLSEVQRGAPLSPRPSSSSTITGLVVAPVLARQLVF